MNRSKIENIRRSRPFRVLDIAIVLVLIATGILSIFLLFGQSGSNVEIFHNGQLVQVQRLNQERDVLLDVTHGTLLLRISNGSVWVEKVDCSDLVCLRRGRISRVNQTIVCSPNNVFVRVVGESDLDGIM